MKKNHPKLEDYFEAARNKPVEPSLEEVTQLIQQAPAPLATGATGALSVVKSWWIVAALVGASAITTYALWPTSTSNNIAQTLVEPSVSQEEIPFFETPTRATLVEMVDDTLPQIPTSNGPETPETKNTVTAPAPEERVEEPDAVPAKVDSGKTTAPPSGSTEKPPKVPEERRKVYKPDLSIEFRDDMPEAEFDAAIVMMNQLGISTEKLEVVRKRKRLTSMTGFVTVEMENAAHDLRVSAWAGQGFKRIYFHIRHNEYGDVICVATEIDGQKMQRVGCD